MRFMQLTWRGTYRSVVLRSINEVERKETDCLNASVFKTLGKLHATLSTTTIVISKAT